MLVLGDKGQDRFRAILGITHVPTVRCAGNYGGLCGFGQTTDRHFVPVSLRREGLFSAEQEGGDAELRQLFAGERSRSPLLRDEGFGILH